MKHLYLTSACNALLAVFTIHAAGLLFAGWRRRPRPEAPHDASSLEADVNAHKERNLSDRGVV